MENTTLVNRRIRVIAVYSDQDGRMQCFPKRMFYRGKEYDFKEIGLRHPTTKGRRMIHVFDMTDGLADYRLEFDAESLSWQLISISDSNYAI